MLGPLAPGGLGPLAQATGANVIVYDTFTGTDGTLLAAHSPNINTPGGAWAIGTGSGLKIVSNKAVQVSAVSAFDVETKLCAADCTITAAVTFVTDGAAQQTMIIFRWTDANNHWRADFAVATSQWRIVEDTAGVVTVRVTAAASLVSGTTYQLKLVLLGNSMNFYVDGVLKCTHSSSVRATVARHGLGIFSGRSTSFDDFRVTIP